jgi:hypothetical protein
MASEIESLIERVDDLKAQLKDANAVLKNALETTPMYAKILALTLKQETKDCKMPEKLAKAHALKATLSNFRKDGTDTTDQ